MYDRLYDEFMHADFKLFPIQGGVSGIMLETPNNIDASIQFNRQIRDYNRF